MSDQMNEAGVKCMGQITLLHPITTLAVVKQRPLSVSEPIRVKRSSFQGGLPALRHLLRSPLGNGEVFLGSQQPGASSAM